MNVLVKIGVAICLSCLLVDVHADKRTPHKLEPGVNLDPPENVNSVVAPPQENPPKGNGKGRRAIDRDNCDQQYKDIFINHTMCLVDVGVEDSVLTTADKTAIVQQHNDFRTNVSPTAKNMLKLIWDDDIAVVAAKWARQCQLGHDPGSARRVPALPGVYVGQNAAYGYASYEAAVIGWHNEVSNFQYGVGAIVEDDAVGHYTQVVSAKAARIGCGSAYCADSVWGTKVHHICNYAIGQGSVIHPYEDGTSCASCASSCSGKLCDCGGKLCHNGGTLDFNTCTCSCPTLYQGDICETLNCPDKDGDMCSLYSSSDCDSNSYVRDTCPQFCGICPKACSGLRCLNLGILDLASCSCQCKTDYSGTSCEILTCPTSQSSWCASKTESSCSAYYNLPYDCPIQCGSCPAPCDGITCENGGSLDGTTCICTCQSSYYSGDRCETLTCPPTQSSWCQSHTPAACAYYSNLPYTCPIQCGSCEAACDGMVCENSSTLDPNTCTCTCYNNRYSGDRCEIVDCVTPDPWYCGGQWPPKYCAKYSNVPHTCVHMCGKC